MKYKVIKNIWIPKALQSNLKCHIYTISFKMTAVYTSINLIQSKNTLAFGCFLMWGRFGNYMIHETGDPRLSKSHFNSQSSPHSTLLPLKFHMGREGAQLNMLRQLPCWSSLTGVCVCVHFPAPAMSLHVHLLSVTLWHLKAGAPDSPSRTAPTLAWFNRRAQTSGCAQEIVVISANGIMDNNLRLSFAVWISAGEEWTLQAFFSLCLW